MAKKNKTKAPVSNRYSKQGFLLSEQFCRYKGALQTLLSDDQYYTFEEVETILNSFLNERVK